MVEMLKNTFEFIAKGGPVMIPILLCSIIAAGLVLERLFSIRKHKGSLNNLLLKLKPILEKKDYAQAIELCGKEKTSIAKVARAVLLNIDRKKEDIESAVDESIITEIPLLEKHVGIVGIIASIAPLLGLLGTVTGMIKAFFVVSKVSLGDPAQLAGGISEALITTAAGLVVGIPTIAAYNYLIIKIDSISWDMEKISRKLINYIHSLDNK